MDECSLMSVPTKGAAWAPKGRRPKVVAFTSKRKRITVFGAIDLRTGEHTAMFIDKGDSESMKCFPDVLAEKYAGKELEILLDNATHHKSKKTREHAGKIQGLSLRYIPSYAPDLNPQEWVFRDFRRTVTHNHRFSAFDSLKKAAGKFFCSIGTPNLLNYAYLNIVS